jgi:hypothetical protein
MGIYLHFKESEFDSPDDPGSGRHIDSKLVNRLDMMREFCGFPFHINSGVRTKQHNAEVGGKDNSEHLIQIDGLAHAVDIACPDSAKRYLMIQAALKYGIRRIGIGDNFIHFGNWYQHPQDVIWTY